MENLWRAEELANFLNVTTASIRAWTLQGMPHYKLGRSVRFDKDKVLEWFAARAKNKTTVQ